MRVLHKHSIRVTNVKRNAEGRNEVYFENNDSKRKLKKILAGDIPVVSFYGARGTGSSLLANNLFGSRFNVNCDRNHPTKGMQTQMSCLKKQKGRGFRLLDFQGSNSGVGDVLNADLQHGLLAFLLSSVVVLSMYTHNVATNYGDPLLRQLFANLRTITRESLHENRVAGGHLGKTRLLVVLHDSLDGEDAKAEVAVEVRARIDRLWAEINDTNGNSTLADFFIVDVAFLPRYNNGAGADNSAYNRSIREDLLPLFMASPHELGPLFDHCRTAEGYSFQHESLAEFDPDDLLAEINKLDSRVVSYVVQKPVVESVRNVCIRQFRSDLCLSHTSLEHDAKDARDSTVRRFNDLTQSYLPKLRDEERQTLMSEMLSIALALNNTLANVQQAMLYDLQTLNYRWWDQETFVRLAGECHEFYSTQYRPPQGVDREAVAAHLWLTPQQRKDLSVSVAHSMFYQKFRRDCWGKRTRATAVFTAIHIYPPLITETINDLVKQLDEIKGKVDWALGDTLYNPRKDPDITDLVSDAWELQRRMWEKVRGPLLSAIARKIADNVPERWRTLLVEGLAVLLERTMEDPVPGPEVVNAE
ncbi:Guanylate-binding protein N-terminal domain [Carpediemonas membranifera]|uniref:Guanylate-binding protein N-terminal domain n=1 Tax=Carpediemonas membranifera TaxID=201153 RepID=A0A8J6EB10_9EUKA|nr:Guanylate-binding protein N-terminal domain [Carpediemonas membranifera]|eukprot:KAG9395920.1 Guanylate-binding protein N-terminal domain [Carpediemonas membranifera]